MCNHPSATIQKYSCSILPQNRKICYNGDTLIPGSSMVEQEAVNFEVAGSSPVPGATNKKNAFWALFLFVVFLGWMRTSGAGSPSQGDEQIRKTSFSYSETTQRGRLLRKQKSSPVPGAIRPYGLFCYLDSNLRCESSPGNRLFKLRSAISACNKTSIIEQTVKYAICWCAVATHLGLV